MELLEMELTVDYILQKTKKQKKKQDYWTWDRKRNQRKWSRGKKKTLKTEQSLSDLWDNIKWSNIIGASPKQGKAQKKIWRRESPL